MVSTNDVLKYIVLVKIKDNEHNHYRKGIGSKVIDNKDRIICALDFDDPARARRLVEELGDLVNFYKVGMLMQFVGGREIISWLLEKDKKVFLDMKYYDIPETVASVVKQVARTGIHFLTIHGNSKIIEQAVEARGDSALKLMAITVLTSMDADDMEELGLSCPVQDMVMYRVKKAIDFGCDGIITSGREAGMIKQNYGSKIITVTPGIRPAGTDLHEHKRSVTPREAIASGADYLVIGRPIYGSPDPRKTVQEIRDEMMIC